MRHFFASNNTHIGGLTRIGTDLTWITYNKVSVAPFKITRVVITNHLNAKRIEFSAVYDWNIWMRY
jgi:hypothetical protein